MIRDTGICPRCQSKEVYYNKNHRQISDRSSLYAGNFSRFLIFSYACFDCGYIEEFIDENDLKNEKTMRKARETWSKLG